MIQVRGCEGDDCPKVFKTERGTYVVQGDVFNAITTPDGETAVEVPFAILQGL
ncbi:hypothetical protein AB0I81_50395 [Nonomuraea sp. NPDC050404]|uniref:hypothetical protein n=1 Tax=Nonomuraea sp. NPDC050404 TaxID=3155783 RepID=UPI0033CAF0F0